MTGLSEISANLSGPWLVGALAGIGLVVGVLTGLFGVGGAFLIVPVLNIALGIPYTLATGSSMSFTLGTGAAGWARHMRLGNVAVKTMTILSGAAACGTVLGADLHACLRHCLGQRTFTLTMHGLFIVALAATAWLVFAWSPRERQGPSLLQRFALGPRIHIRQADMPGVSLPGLCLAGLAVGVLKGLLGIGGGVLLMPLMLVVVGLEIRQAVGTSLGVVLFSSLVGAVVYGQGGHASLWIVMPLLAGSIVGVQAGTWMCHRLHAQHIRRYFALLVLLVIVVVGWDFVRKMAS